MNSSEKTIIILGVCSFLATLIMVVRLALRKVRRQNFNLSDYLTIAAVVCLTARVACVTVFEIWGNNNITAAYRANIEFTATDIYRRGVGSKLTICDRMLHTT